MAKKKKVENVFEEVNLTTDNIESINDTIDVDKITNDNVENNKKIDNTSNEVNIVEEIKEKIVTVDEQETNKKDEIIDTTQTDVKQITKIKNKSNSKNKLGFNDELYYLDI